MNQLELLQENIAALRIVRNLVVEANNGHVTIRGLARSFHAKQLAQQEAIKQGGWASINNEVVVD